MDRMKDSIGLKKGGEHALATGSILAARITNFWFFMIFNEVGTMVPNDKLEMSYRELLTGI
jgi:hypothetical protein